MELKMRKNKDVYIVDVSGEMDLYNSYKLKDLIAKMIERQVKCIVLNLDLHLYNLEKKEPAVVYHEYSRFGKKSY